MGMIKISFFFKAMYFHEWLNSCEILTMERKHFQSSLKKSDAYPLET